MCGHCALGTEPHPLGQYADTCGLLIQAGVLLDAVDEVYGRTAAHWAAYYDQFELLDILMQGGTYYIFHTPKNHDNNNIINTS